MFNALARLSPSDFRTFVVFVSCPSPEDIDELTDASLPGIGYVEDWTHSIVNYCLRCSYGSPHRHEASTDDWAEDRNLGIGAQSRASVEKLLDDWVARGRGRMVESIEEREHPAPEPEQGHVWWREPEEDEAQAQST